MGKSTKKALSRTERAQQRLHIQQKELALQKVLANHNRHSGQTLSGWVKQLLKKPGAFVPAKRDVPAVLSGLITQLSQAKDHRKREAFAALLALLEKSHCNRLLAEEKYVRGLYAMACHAVSFIRPVADWKRRSYQPEKQFSALLRHLFARYTVPVFMDKAWLPDGTATEQQWFIGLAQGASVRNLRGLPLSLTKRMAHEFLQAPDYCSITHALRYAQVVALGGDEWLAWHLNRTSLGRNGFRNDDFWLSVIHFFARAPFFDVRRLDELVDYLNHQRLVQDTFSMKGRTLDALMRQSEVWHAQIHRERNLGGRFQWQPCGIRTFEREEGTGIHTKVYKIRELLSSNELLAEGRAMRHCVYTYSRSAHAGKCAIFTVTVDNFSNPERLATLEVDLKERRIVQAKARCNDAPAAKTLEIIREWAAAEGLQVCRWIR